MMYAAISADIVSSTSLSIDETVSLKKRIENLFLVLQDMYPGFWGRLIKGDYMECILPSAKDAFRVALLIKTCIKSFPLTDSKEKKMFQTYGVRIAVGIGDMRMVDKEQGIMDGEAIYMSGRALDGMQAPNRKGTIIIDSSCEEQRQALQTIGMLVDALMNNATRKQCEVLFYKLQYKGELEIADILGLTQSAVNQHSTTAKWYCIEEALNYFEQLQF